MKKFVLFSAIVAVLTFAASNARAVLGVFTISGTATLQTTNKDGSPLMKTQSVALQNVLTILEQGTGDVSLTNKHVTTKLYYDPDAYNDVAYTSLEGQSYGGTFGKFYGVFYYSNSVSGLVRLDGQDDSDYYSYIELDYWNAITGLTEGFWNPTAMETDTVATKAANGLSAKATGNAILYVHSNPSYACCDIVGMESNSPSFFFANDSLGAYNSYAITIHGNTASTWTYNGIGTVKETLKLTGSGDVLWGSAGSGAFSKGAFSFSGQGD